jgi:hypothetical protein
MQNFVKLNRQPEPPGVINALDVLNKLGLAKLIVSGLAMLTLVVVASLIFIPPTITSSIDITIKPKLVNGPFDITLPFGKPNLSITVSSVHRLTSY